MSYEQKQKVSTAVATIAVAGCLGIIYVAIRAFAADGGEQIRGFSSLEDGIFSSNTKLISTIGVATGVILLLFLLLTGAIGKLFALLGIKKEYVNWGGKIKTGQLYVRRLKLQLALVGVFCVVVALAFKLKPDPKFAPFLLVIPIFIAVFRFMKVRKQTSQAENTEEEQEEDNA